MDVEELRRLVETSRRSAFRLEALPQYLVPQEAAEFAAWREGRPQPLRTPETSPWLAQIEQATARGCRWYRVHILDHPLTDYTRFELHGYLANQSAGEEIYVAERRGHAELENLREDFWLVDDAVAVQMIYDEEGHFLRPERAADVESYRELRDSALNCAEPLDDYLDRTRLKLNG